MGRTPKGTAKAASANSFSQRLSPTMRQEMRPATRSSSTGKKIPIVDRKTGEIREAEIFVAVLGAYSFHLCRIDLDANTPRLDWLACPDVPFLQGVPRRIVPDNLKSGVIRAPDGLAASSSPAPSRARV